jgi:hypothetical protein
VRTLKVGAALAAVVLGIACGGGGKSAALDTVRAIRQKVEPRFRPPEDGKVTQAQVDLYLRLRGAGPGGEVEAARAQGVDPAELQWTRSRIAEALQALDARVVRDSAVDSYTKGIAALREARRVSRDPKTSARLDAEIADLEHERTAAKRAEPLLPGVAQNAALIAPRRAQIESAGP